MQRIGMNKTPNMHKNAAVHNLTGPYSPSPPVRTNFPDDDASNFQSIVQFREISDRVGPKGFEVPTPHTDEFRRSEEST